MHTCDNPKCCNPKHLVDGTHAENAADRERKGRSYRCPGERNPNAKLTDDDVLIIRQLNDTQENIALRFNVSACLISRIKSRKCWKHI